MATSLRMAVLKLRFLLTNGLSRLQQLRSRLAWNASQELRWLCLWAALVVLLSVWFNVAFYTIQRQSESFDEWPVPSVKVFVSGPKYLSANEDEDIRFAVENAQDANLEVVLRLENGGKLIGFLASGGSNVVYSGTVQTREQINRQSRILFPWNIHQSDSPLGRGAGLSLWGGVNNSQADKKALSIGVAPIPWSKSLSSFVGALLSALTLWIIKELWDQVRESES